MTEKTGIIPYEELTIQDNFIFQKVMRNKRICKGTLERLLDIEIKDIGYPEEEKSINVRLDSKSIRLFSSPVGEALGHGAHLSGSH